jgi:hypothetical protein
MELKNIFLSVAVVLVGIVAVSLWLTGLNASYGTTAGSTFNNTITSVSATLNSDLGTIATSTGNNTIAQSGAGASTQQEGLISRSLSSIQQIGSFFTIVPSLLEDGATILGLPQPFAQVASWAFTFVLAITIALILLQVVARFF